MEEELVIDYSKYNKCFEYNPLNKDEVSIINVENGKLDIDKVVYDYETNMIWLTNEVHTFKIKDGSRIMIGTIDHEDLVIMSLSEIKVKDFIMRKLGYPIVKLELTLQQIKDSIDEAIEELAPWVVQPTHVTVDASSRIDLSEYNVSYIINVIPADRDTSIYDGILNGRIRDIFSTSYYESLSYKEALYHSLESGQLDRIQSSSIGGISWKPIDSNGIMMLDVGSTGAKRVTIEYSPKIKSIDDLTDDIYLTFVKKFALAFTRATLSDIRGKFKVEGSPVELDASEQYDKSNSELERLRTELKETVSTHFMID